jgi:hypothetical protein
MRDRAPAFRQLRGSPRRRASSAVVDRPDAPAFPRPRVRATGRRRADPPSRFDSPRGLMVRIASALLVASSEARRPVDHPPPQPSGAKALVSRERGTRQPPPQARSAAPLSCHGRSLGHIRPGPACRQSRVSRRRRRPERLVASASAPALPRLRASSMCLLAARSAAACKRTSLSLPWPRSHPAPTAALLRLKRRMAVALRRSSAPGSQMTKRKRGSVYQRH